MPRSLLRILLLSGVALLLQSCETGKMLPSMPVQKSPVQRQNNAYFYYLESQELSRQGKIPEAVAALQKAVNLDPDTGYLKRELAALYIQQNRDSEALELLGQVIADDPGDAEALLLKGRIHQNANRMAEAKAAYQAAIDQGKQQENVYLILGNLYLQNEELEAAEATFSQLVEDVPDSYAGYFFLGRVFTEKGDLDGAEAAFLKALDLEPELESARFELIDLYRMQTDTAANRKRVLGLYREILDQDAYNVQAVTGLSIYYRDIGEFKKSGDLLRDLSESTADEEISRSILKFYIERNRSAEAAYVLEELLKIKPGNANYHFLAGLAFERADDVDKALWHYQRVSPNSPRYRDAVLQATLLFHSNGRTSDAIDYLKNVVDREPDNAELRLYLGQLYEEIDDLKAAEGELRKAIELAPDNDKAYFELGVLYDKMERKDDSIAYMKKVIELNPRHANALNYLGYTYADLGIKLDEAESLIRRALELKPGDGYFTDSLGWVYYQKGQYQKALEFLIEALRLAPDDPIIAEHVGDAYLKLGNREKALEFYRKSLEIKSEDREALIEKINRLENPPVGNSTTP